MKIHIHHRKTRRGKANCHGCIDIEKGQGIGVKVGSVQVMAGQISDGDVIVEVRSAEVPSDSFFVEDHLMKERADADPKKKKASGKVLAGLGHSRFDT